MEFKVPGVILADGPPSRRLAGFVNGLAIAGNQVMPIGQRFPVGPQTIGACFRKPVQAAQILAVELHTIRNTLQPVLVIEACTVPAVQQLARHVGGVQQACLLILELVDAATPATIAQGLPLSAIERVEGLFPKGPATIHDKGSLALLVAADQGTTRSKLVKPLNFAIAFAAGIVAMAVPAAAQMSSFSSPDEFINAVRERDGDKATQMLSESPGRYINSHDGKGDTALTIAVARSDENWTGFLLGKGADPNRPGKGGDTPLIIASRNGFDQGVQWLLLQGAKVDATNNMGETALIAAVMQRQTAAVRRLLEAGADPDKADTSAGYSARDYALRDTRARDILRLIEAKKPKK